MVRFPACLISLFMAALPISSAIAQSAVREISVFSPDHRIEARIGTQPGLDISVNFRGVPVIVHSPLGLKLRGEAATASAGNKISITTRSSDTTWKTVCGKNSTVRDHFKESTIALGAAPGASSISLIVRCYDDGVAFRYRISPAPASSRHTLEAELTAFHFSSDAECWAAGKDPAYETEYRHTKLGTLTSSTLTALPLLVRVKSDLYAAIAEADLTDWAGAYLAGLDGKLLFSTGVLRGNSAAEKISVSVEGLQTMVLHVGDGGDDYQFDHADWADARLIAPDGTATALSSLKPTSATQGFGSLQLNRSVDGNPIVLGGKTYDSGLGTHSIGNITYDLGGKYSRFEATVGIDSETKGKGSVTFSVLGTRASDGKVAPALQVKPAPRTDGEGLVTWTGSEPKLSPWRVIMLGTKPGELVESEIIENLSAPCAIADTSWIKPGMMAWDHWWSGDVKMDTATDERYIQFAGEMGWPYQLVDWQWYGSFDNPGADITHVNPAVDMPALLKYAEEYKVKLWVWLHSNDVNRFLTSGKLDAAFATYQQWGLAGVKIDFMNRDDQEMVNWYETIVKLAARHKLMVDFHGAFKPTGLRRTWPNLMTREGVLGNEYNKFSNRVTPEHTLTLPFTRMLVGPMDFTPGGFINTTKAAFKQTLPTQVMGSRCHQLAMFVVYDSPLCCVCDDPDNYRGQPGIEFLRGMPTSWDETHVLEGEVGSHILTARRSGTNWYVGGMSGDAGYNTELSLGYLGKGRFEMTLYADAADAGVNPTHIVISKRIVGSTDRIPLTMAQAGGVAIVFRKL